MKLVCGAVVAFAACGSAFAEDAVTPVDAVWTNATDSAPSWMALANWTDAEGGAITRPPTNVADGATFPVGPVANGCLQQIKLDIGTTSSVRKEIGLASLVDENPITRHAISLAGRYYSSCWEASVWLTLCDPNRFNGYITSHIADGTTTGTPGFGIRLPATAEKPLSLAGELVVNGTAVSGRRIVDFGRCRSSDDESWGPVYCALSFSETRKNIREVFCGRRSSSGWAIPFISQLKRPDLPST